MADTHGEVEVVARGSAETQGTDAHWFGQPRGLSTLFFTELWERFSFYGMRAILVLFMTNAMATGGLGMTDGIATAIYGLYTAAVYLSGLPGGWIADRLLGQRRAVFLGGAIIAAGHFTLAVPSMATFYGGLVLIVLGTGLLKPNISAMVGDLYPEGGASRDAGFSIYYMGINIGAFFGPLICGLLGERVNWHLGFSAAGIGMVLGLVQYAWGSSHLRSAGELNAELQAPAARRQASRSLLLGTGATLILLLLLSGLQASGMVSLSLIGVVDAIGYFILVTTIALLVYVAFFAGLDTEERGRIGVIAVCFLASAVFWSGFEQAGSSMNLFAERLTDRLVFDWEMPASWLQSVNALFIVLLAPVFSFIWLWLGTRNPSIPAKFAYGLMQLGLGFVVMAWAALNTADGSLVGPSWLVVTYFLHTTGELCLSPVGLSSITKLSPRRFVGQMMGIWFVGAALGNLIAGRVAGLTEALALPQLFGAIALFTAGTGLVLLLLARPIARMAGDVQ